MSDNAVRYDHCVLEVTPQFVKCSCKYFAVVVSRRVVGKKAVVQIDARYVH